MALDELATGLYGVREQFCWMAEQLSKACGVDIRVGEWADDVDSAFVQLPLYAGDRVGKITVSRERVQEYGENLGPAAEGNIQAHNWLRMMEECNLWRKVRRAVSDLGYRPDGEIPGIGAPPTRPNPRNFRQGPCEIHGCPLQEEEVPMRYGLIRFSQEYLAAAQRLFPNARTSVLGGCRLDRNLVTARVVRYCPECRAARAAWIEAHGAE